MHLIATTEEKLNIFLFCISTGLPYFVDYGYTIDWKQGDYNTAHDALIKAEPDKTFFLEDIQTQMLRMGYGLKFKNIESPECSATLTLALIEKNWDKAPVRLIDMIHSEDTRADAITADTVMQYLLLGKEIFG